MTGGEVDLELWEPQLGLADGRGGVHVDWGVTGEDPAVAADRVTLDATAIDETESGIRIRDPHGHYFTLCENRS